MGYERHVERPIDAPAEVVYRARADIDIDREISGMFGSSSDPNGDMRSGSTGITGWGPQVRDVHREGCNVVLDRPAAYLAAKT